MTDREALKLALEALETYGAHEGTCDKMFLLISNPPKRKACSCGLSSAITVIKEALAQPEHKYELVTYGEVWSSDGETWSRDGKVMDLAQPEERNFCPRCGKRTADLTTIHTCTPPQENT
jgi:hypothetical protein